MSEPTSLPAAVVADTIVRTVELGVTITDAAVDGDTTVVFCDLLDDGGARCPGCGSEGLYRDTVIRQRDRCAGGRTSAAPAGTGAALPLCQHRLRAGGVRPQHLPAGAAGLVDHAALRALHLRRLMIDRATVAAVARELGLSWDTVNTIAMDATQHDRGHRHRLASTGCGSSGSTSTAGRIPAGRGEDGYVTVIIDLTPVLEGTGRARLLDLVAGRSAAALTSWLADQSQAFRDQVEIVAMDGFGGYKTAATDVVPDATAVMDPFHVVALAGAKLDLCRQRIQQQTCGHRGRSGDPLYRVRRTLRTRYPLLNSRQKPAGSRFRRRCPLAVELVTWGVYQRLIAAYAHPDPRRGKTMMTAIIDTLRTGVPAALEELAQLGRTLHRRRARRAGLLRPPRLQRTHRSHQRPPRSPAQKRPRIPQPHPLPTALTTALRQPGPPINAL